MQNELLFESECPDRRGFVAGLVIGIIFGILVFALFLYGMYLLAQYHFHKGWGKLQNLDETPLPQSKEQPQPE